MLLQINRLPRHRLLFRPLLLEILPLRILRILDRGHMVLHKVPFVLLHFGVLLLVQILLGFQDLHK